MTNETRPQVRARSETLPRGNTLRASADYLRCYRRGDRIGGRYARLHTAENAAGHPRLGITASRKVGGAVVRNRLKRRVREIYRRWRRRHDMPSIDVVVHLKPEASQAAFAQLREELLRQLSIASRRNAKPRP
jgi:ribonuclease P protein component